MKCFLVLLFALLVFIVVFVRPDFTKEKSYIRYRGNDNYEVNGAILKFDDLHTVISEKWIVEQLNYDRYTHNIASSYSFTWYLCNVKVFGKLFSLSLAGIVLLVVVLALWIVCRQLTKHCTRKHSVLPEYIKPSHLIVSDKI